LAKRSACRGTVLGSFFEARNSFWSTSSCCGASRRAERTHEGLNPPLVEPFERSTPQGVGTTTEPRGTLLNTRPGGLAPPARTTRVRPSADAALATKASLVTTTHPGRGGHGVDQPGNTSRANLLIPWPARPWRWRPPWGWMWTTRDLPPPQGNLGWGRPRTSRCGSNAGRTPAVDEGARSEVGAATRRPGRARLSPSRR